jgi:hypothetical protein
MAGRTGIFGTGGQVIIYQNEDGVFSPLNTTLPNMAEGQVLWGDYDTDGDLDLLMTGRLSNGQGITALYRNDNGSFVDSGMGPNTLSSGAAAWGDFDADGDPDLVISDFVPGPDVYRNDNGSFVGVANVSNGFTFGAVWGDYDQDNDLDLLIADIGGTRLYRNDNGNFIDTQFSFPLLNPNAINSNVDVAWADYDNDGDLDLLFAGSNFTDLYRNTGNGFVRDENDLTAFSQVAAGWADYDQDGDLDLLMAGSRVVLYRNNTIF